MRKKCEHKRTKLLEDRKSWILSKCLDCNKLIEICDEKNNSYIKVH